MKLDRWLQTQQAQRRAKKALIASIVLTVVIYLMPLGGIVGYPLMLLSTLAHELGHGLTALAVGQRFESLQIFADGSGVAHHSGAASAGAKALVAAGGLVGPALVAAVGFIAGRSARASRVVLGIAAVVLAVLTALFVRNVFGLVFTSAVVLGMGWVAIRKAAETAQLVLVFLAIQLALSVFSSADYLFTDVAHTGAGVMPSDVAHMAQALGGPYWLWGLACGAFSILVLLGGLWWFWRVFDDRT